MTKQELQDMTAKLCGILTELGFEYHYEADNRSDRKSHYIYVRKPAYMEIRLSDHAGNRVKHRKRFDIGPHGITLEQAVVDLQQIAPNRSHQQSPSPNTEKP